MKRFLIALSIFLTPLALFAYVSPGKPVGFVNDFARLLNPATVASLNQDLTAFSNQTGNEISVVTIETLGDDTIENYAVQMFREYGIGNEKLDTGVLLLISKNDRTARIEVGYGLEPVLTDIETSHIIQDVLVPAFQQEDYDAGVVSSVSRIKSDIVSGQPMDTTPLPDSTNKSSIPGLLSHFTYPIFFVVLMLGSVLGRSKSWWAGGVIGGIIAIGIGVFSSIGAGMISGIILIPLGLLFDYIASKRGGGGSGGVPPFLFFGGGGFGGRGGGGGFGGFGGGMSGGGGSSGKW